MYIQIWKSCDIYSGNPVEPSVVKQGSNKSQELPKERSYTRMNLRRVLIALWTPWMMNRFKKGFLYYIFCPLSSLSASPTFTKNKLNPTAVFFLVWYFSAEYHCQDFAILFLNREISCRNLYFAKHLCVVRLYVVVLSPSREQYRDPLLLHHFRFII